MSSFAFESDAAAAEALAAANNGEVAPPDPSTQQAPADSGTQGTVDAGTNQSSESFTNIDINSLPDELKPLVQEKFNQFQADYTRKTQEIAPVRQLMSETGMSAEEARQALEFVQSLNDPTQVQALYEHLAQQFEVEDPTVDDGGVNVDPRDRQIEDLGARLERFEQQQALTAAQTELQSVQTSLKSAHPDLTDGDMERIQKIAVAHMQAHSGNPSYSITHAMTAAAEDFNSWKQDVLGAYVQGKGQVATNGTPPLPGTAHAQTPDKFENLDDATKAALARFGNDWAN